MKVAVASDHAGFCQKADIIKAVEAQGATVEDFGPATEDRVDYPDFAARVAQAVEAGEADRGILICGTGLGMAMAADKFPGIRAVAVTRLDFARLAREHNDANVLCLSGRFVTSEDNAEIVKEFLTTEFAGGRHTIRVEKMMGNRVANPDALEKIAGTTRFSLIVHPLIQHKVAILRDSETGTKQFRELIRELALFEGYEATRDFPLEEIEVQTPLEKTKAARIKGKKVAIVPILRAGLGMVDGLLELLPSASVGHIGMFRDPKTKEPQPYYCKLPSDIENRTVLLVDPMLATGGSANAAIDCLRDAGVKDVRLLVIDAAPEGVNAVLEHDSTVRIFAAALDRQLNNNAYILPGFGDAGDRIFGTF